MLPELQFILSDLDMHASILRDYGDIIGIDAVQLAGELVVAFTNICHKVSQNRSMSPEPSQSQLASETDSESQLPEVVMEFLRWGQEPSPPWFQDSQFQRFHSNAPAESVTELDTSSITEPDTGSVTESEYSFGVDPIIYNVKMNEMIDHLYDLRDSAAITVQELRAWASGVEFYSKITLFMLVFIRHAARDISGPRHEAEFTQFVKSSVERLFEAQERLQRFIAGL